jgi:hypothetical protein
MKHLIVRPIRLLVVIWWTISACQTANVAQRFFGPPTDVPAESLPEQSQDVATPTQFVAQRVPLPITGATAPVRTAQVAPSFTTSPMPTLAPTVQLAITAPTVPMPSPTIRLQARAPAKPATPTKIPPTPPPSFLYHESFAWCGPNWQTFVEGTVTLDGIPQNGLLVRISLDRDGAPAWDDYKTGTDLTKPGGYTQIIDANAPHGGLWYLWIVDPQSHQRISQIAAIKTDPKRIEETSCQSATIDFSN